MDLPQLAVDATRSSLDSLCTTVDLGGTGTGLVALAAAAAVDGHGDVLCDNTVRSLHGEQRFIGDTFSVATLDCMLSNTSTHCKPSTTTEHSAVCGAKLQQFWVLVLH